MLFTGDCGAELSAGVASLLAVFRSMFRLYVCRLVSRSPLACFADMFVCVWIVTNAVVS